MNTTKKYTAEQIYEALKDEFKFVGADGYIKPQIRNL